MKSEMNNFGLFFVQKTAKSCQKLPKLPRAFHLILLLQKNEINARKSY